MVSPHAIHAQQIHSGAPCPSSLNARDEQPAGPEISIAEVTFSGSLQMPVPEQDQIAASIEQRTHGNALDRVVDEALERVRAGWQDRGYFKVLASGDARNLTSSPVSQRIALSVRVDEGSEYSLSRIRFKNNKAISDRHVLRGLFPINDGDIFSRAKIGTGLENLRNAYGELGYINFTSVPDTKFDDENKLISLAIDMDEGKQFFLRGVEVLGLEESARQEVLKDLPISGEVYNSRLWEQSFLKYRSMLPECECRWHDPRRFDEKAGAVTVTLDFRPCSTD